MRIGLAPIDSGTDTRYNLSQIQALARAARDDGADLVAFPEFSMYAKKVVDATFAQAAEPLDEPFARALGELTRELEIALVVGLVESNAHDRRPYNTLAVFDRTGRLVAAYRKIHLFDSYGFHESASIAPATDLSPVTFDISGVRVGLMTCYDLRFPELARCLADAGAQLILVCSSWVPGDGKAEQWRILAQARAIENACFVAAVEPTDVAAMRRRNTALEHRRFAVVPARHAC